MQAAASEPLLVLSGKSEKINGHGAAKPGAGAAVSEKRSGQMSIKIENIEILGWEAAIRGARNLMSTRKESDSWFFDYGSSDGDQEYKHYHN